MTSSASAAQQPAAHHRPHALGGVLADRVGRRDADALNEDVRQHDSGERVAEHPGPRRIRGQVAAEVGGVAGPRHREAERDRHLEDERADEVGPCTVAGVMISCPPTSFTANTTKVVNSTTVSTACIRWISS